MRIGRGDIHLGTARESSMSVCADFECGAFEADVSRYKICRPTKDSCCFGAGSCDAEVI